MPGCSVENGCVVYLCSVIDEKTKAERSIFADSPAATKKVLDVSRALKSRVARIYVLSMGRGKQVGETCKHVAIAKRLSGIPVLYAYFSPIMFLTYIFSSLSLIPLMLRIRKQNRGGRVHIIVYNRQWLYIPVLLVSRLFHMKCYLDLEDSALIEEAGLIESLSIKLNKFLFDCLCSHGSILVNSGLTEQVKTRNNIVCYGVAKKQANIVECEWSGKSVHFLLGGSLLRETGVLLLIDAVKILNSEFSFYKGRFVIDITGYGDMADDLDLLCKHEGEGWIAYHGRVSMNQYNFLLSQSHVGLCLKLPSSEMGVQTFPSKTIEIASFGKLLLTTELGHVSVLFGENGAYYLTEESGRCLAEMIISIVENPDASMRTAKIGQERLLRTCNSERVADDICRLFENGMQQ